MSSEETKPYIPTLEDNFKQEALNEFKIFEKEFPQLLTPDVCDIIKELYDADELRANINIKQKNINNKQKDLKTFKNEFTAEQKTIIKKELASQQEELNKQKENIKLKRIELKTKLYVANVNNFITQDNKIVYKKSYHYDRYNNFVKSYINIYKSYCIISGIIWPYDNKLKYYTEFYHKYDYWITIFHHLRKNANVYWEKQHNTNMVLWNVFGKLSFSEKRSYLPIKN